MRSLLFNTTISTSLIQQNNSQGKSTSKVVCTSWKAVTSMHFSFLRNPFYNWFALAAPKIYCTMLTIQIKNQSVVTSFAKKVIISDHADI